MLPLLDYGQIIVGIGAIVAGIWLIIWIKRQDQKVQRSLSWPYTEGKILRSDVHSEWNPRMHDTYHSAEIEYEYTVDSQIFRCDTICIGGEFYTTSRRRAEAHCEKYPVGSTVNIYYNPLNPEEACLERAGEGRPWAYVAALGAVVFGIWFITLGLDRLKKPMVYEVPIYDSAGRPQSKR